MRGRSPAHPHPVVAVLDENTLLMRGTLPEQYNEELAAFLAE
ncbi:MAG: hypothetical protein OXC56_04515 [Chloroflexi bacterium]|nr:hypothetical protein [Chloroflexota bacterium]